MTTDAIAAIREALATLSPEALSKVSDALVAARDDPTLAVEAFRDAAREIVATDPDAAETFMVCAQILEEEIGKRDVTSG